MTSLTNDIMDSRQIRFLLMAELYIKENNKKGFERDIVEFGHKIEEYSLLTQEKYIDILCRSDYPITAAMTVKSLHHDKAIKLEEFIKNNVESFDWSLFHRIIILTFLNERDSIIKTLNEINDFKLFHMDIKKSIEFLYNQSEYKYFFELLYVIINCKYGKELIKYFDYKKTHEYYIKQNFNIIQNSIKTLYDNKEYDLIFYTSKNFDLFRYLEVFLYQDVAELEKEFLGINTINGIKLTFRIYQEKFSDDEKAYKFIIQKMSRMVMDDNIQYLYFYYLLKLIKIQGYISEEVKERLINMGKVSLLNNKMKGIILLAECLEIIINPKDMTAYYEFIDLLGDNHIFTYKKDIPQIYPYQNYTEMGKDGEIYIDIKKFKNIGYENEFDDIDYFEFYINSFYEYLLPINDFFLILYKNSEDRVLLKRKLSEYVFYGRITSESSIKLKTGFAYARFLNVFSNRSIRISKKDIGKIQFDLLKKGDIFSCKLLRYDPNPVAKFIGIYDFKFIKDDKNTEYENTTQKHWKTLKDCFYKIISKEEFTIEDQKTIKSIPNIEFGKGSMASEYYKLYSEVLLSLKSKYQEIIKFIETLGAHGNNLFDINDNDSAFLSISRTNQLLVLNAQQTIDSFVNTNIIEKDLIWIYLNSYLRLVIDIKLILNLIMKPEEKTLRLDSIFSNVRLFGILIKEDDVDGDIVYVNAVSINATDDVKFSMEKEQMVTQAYIQNNSLISFGLKEYCREAGYIEIQGIRVQVKNGWLRGWEDIHECHEQIKYLGTAKKEDLEAISRLPKLKYNEIEFNKLLDGFIFSMNNLCDKKDVLFDYIRALDKNNPYQYDVDKLREDITVDLKNCNQEQSKVIINQMIENDYNLYRSMWVYLNSYLCDYVSLDYLLIEYYNSSRFGEKDSVRYLTGLDRIQFLASVKIINEGKIFLEFTEIPNNSKLFIRSNDTDYTENDFYTGQKVKITLVEYNQSENMIGIALIKEGGLMYA